MKYAVMKYAVIDISSSSISLTAADDKGSEPFFRARESLTLLHYMDGHALSQRGIEKLIEAVLAMQEKCRSVGVDMLYLISTAALRVIENCEEVARAVTERTGLEVRLWDERRSSVEAHAILSANGKREKKHKKSVDALAAALILEGYLGSGQGRC